MALSSMYYKDAVMSELNSIQNIPKSLIETGGLKIYTYFDSDAQKKLDNIVNEEMAGNENLQVASMIRNPKNGGFDRGN